jgi:subtilase family serine protease
VRTTLVRDLPGALATSSVIGPLAGGVLLPHIKMGLTRPANLQAALDALARAQHTRGSSAYRQWLSPISLRAYGPAQADIDKVVAWLRSHGLHVNSVSPSGMTIDFGGTVGNVAAAFRTRIDNVVRNGEAHVSTVAAPAIPAALAPVVSGVTLSNFFPKPMMRRITKSLTTPNGPATIYAVTPADFATIYNVNPLRGKDNFYGQPITGAGATLAVVEQTEIQSSDWETFRNAFGLSKAAGYTGTLKLVNPHCASPGFTGDEGEAALDAEWSFAVAPNATIIEAACGGTAPFEFGVMTTLTNLVENGTAATIFSISYGGDETANGYAFTQMWSNLVEEGAVEGKAIFVSTGDSGVSANEGSLDTNGLFVNALSDTAYNVAVGGTDFYDTALGENATYWKSTNSSTFGSALSYIPEIPWNNACSSSIIWKFYHFTGPITFCNSSLAATEPLQNDVGGSGSQSAFYTKPDWQLTSVPGMPNDGVRDQPDVSLFAANGIWNHFYVFCMSDANEGGNPCVYTSTDAIFGNAAGGTSFAAPAFAGIAALIQQTYISGKTVIPLGNPAPVFYAIAKAQYTTPLGFSGCNSSLGNKISPACAFNYVTAGDNSEPCVSGTASCESSVASVQRIGVLEAALGGKDVAAYPAGAGYSLATGLGSVNVTNLVYNFYLGL